MAVEGTCQGGGEQMISATIFTYITIILETCPGGGQQMILVGYYHPRTRFRWTPTKVALSMFVVPI